MVCADRPARPGRPGCPGCRRRGRRHGPRRYVGHRVRDPAATAERSADVVVVSSGAQRVRDGAGRRPPASRSAGRPARADRFVRPSRLHRRQATVADAVDRIGSAGSPGFLRAAVLRGGGLNHRISALHPSTSGTSEQRGFIDAYVFPDGELAPIGTTVTLLEDAGFEVRDVHALREYYGRTPRAWASGLDSEWAATVKPTGRGRARVWRLYTAASALGFEQARIGISQVPAVKTDRDGTSDMPPARNGFLG
ncbi:class I SAM-dependent methyltransferase [Actinoplanes sp. NPDC020271]|uniref:class I SAM-dependent methyltransferase n=1 Tax=Actinoplanes sp. NPDC020271 TaxID=3363896 RepID=UPI0037944F3F